MIVHLLQHARRLLASRAYAKKTAEKRSPHWRKVEKEHLEKHPTCAACGGRKKIQVHHESPFHSHPELELEPTNLITLCMALKKDCHILVGHGDSFAYYNPDVVSDARRCLEHPEQRTAVIAMAKAKRLRNEPGGS